MGRDMGVGLSRTAVVLRAVGGLKKLNLTWHPAGLGVPGHSELLMWWNGEWRAQEIWSTTGFISPAQCLRKINMNVFRKHKLVQLHDLPPPPLPYA